MEVKKNLSTETTTPTGDGSLYDLSFFDPRFSDYRKQLIGLLFYPLVYISLLMWGCLSLYYGSLYWNNNLSKTSVFAVDLDGGLLGQQIIAGIKASQANTPAGLHWRFDAAINETALSRETVLDEQAWAVLEISPNASANLDHALASGLPSYDPLSSVTLFFASARNQLTVNSKVVPAVLAVVNPLITKAAIAHTAQFISVNNGNTTALTLAKSCPQCLAAPFALAQKDLVPFTSAPAVGSTMVGMIFLLTFAFSVFEMLRRTYTIIGAKLKIRDTLILRTVSAMVFYFLLSLWYTLVNLAFGVPMDGWRSQGQGFMVYWMLNLCTMASVGLAMESLFTVIGMKWSGYFLTFWVHVNVAASFTSFELMPGFYRYGYGFPFYHSIQGARTIMFGTKSHLGRNFGVLLAWVFVGWAGIMIFTTWNIRRNERKRIHIVP